MPKKRKDPQEEVSTANCTPKLSPNINPAIILFVLNDKTRLEPASANTATTSSTTNDVQEQSLYTDPTIPNDTQQQSHFLRAVTVNFDAQTSACPITAEKSDFAKVLSAASPLPH